MRTTRKTPRFAAAAAVVVAMVMAFAALGGVGLAQTSGGPGGAQYGKKKVWVCHKGQRTVRVSKSAVAKHLVHGDKVGKCDKRGKKGKKHEDHHKGKSGKKFEDSSSKGKGSKAHNPGGKSKKDGKG